MVAQLYAHQASGKGFIKNIFVKQTISTNRCFRQR